MKINGSILQNVYNGKNIKVVAYNDLRYIDNIKDASIIGK